MIQIKDLTVRFGQKTVFENASFSMPDKGIILLSGVSGIGKTTLLRVLAKTLKPQSGVVTGLELRKISFVFQEPRLLEWRTAAENIALVSNTENALRLLSLVELEEEANSLARNLSGGQKQRVSIARAFAFSKDVVLLDEPFSGLDEQNRRRCADLIRTANCAIVVSHDPSDEALLRPEKKILL